MSLKNVLIVGMFTLLTTTIGWAQNNAGRFQINDLEIPHLAPSGYTSVLTVKLSEPFVAHKTYKVAFWIIGKQLKNKGYSYPIAVFPSNAMETVHRDIFKIVKSRDILPELEVRPPPNFKAQGHFVFTISPKNNYEYVTVALKTTSFGRPPINIKNDVTVTGVRVTPLETTINTPIPKVENGTNNTLLTRELLFSGKTFTVTDKNITIGLYDHRNIDNDVVTILLNNQKVLENLTLKRKKHFINVQLQPGENTITLHAENLGEVAPNTAAILIQSGKTEYKAVLQSTLGESEFFKLNYIPKTN